MVTSETQPAEDMYPIFVVEDRGPAGDVRPRCIRTGEKPRSFFGYFENENGEWMIFEYDTITRQGHLTGLDLGSKVHRVIAGEVGALVLNTLERQWLKVCWAAATTFRPAAEPNVE